MSGVWKFLSDTPQGAALGTAVDAGMNLWDATKKIKQLKPVKQTPMKMGSAQNTVSEKKPMAPKTLKDVLFAKIAGAKPAPVRTLKDVLVEKIANAKKKVQKTAATQNDVNVLDQLIRGVKTAALSDYLPSPETVQRLAGQTYGTLMPTLAIGSAATLAGSAVGSVYDKLSDAVKKHNAYEQMFEEFPALKEVPRTTVDKYWGVLEDYAPKLTINPLVAGQFVENMVNYGIKGIDHALAGQLIQIQKGSREAYGDDQALRTMLGMAGRNFEMGGPRDNGEMRLFDPEQWNP